LERYSLFTTSVKPYTCGFAYQVFGAAAGELTNLINFFLVQDLRESTRLGKIFARIHPALDKHVRESTRLWIKGLREFTRLLQGFARIHSALDKHLRESTRLIMSGISGPDTMGMTFLIRRKVNAKCLFLETCG